MSVSPLPYNLGPSTEVQRLADCNREEVKTELNHCDTGMKIQIGRNLVRMVWFQRVWSKI